MEPFLSKHKYGTTYINININSYEYLNDARIIFEYLDFDIKVTLYWQTSNDNRGRHEEQQVQLLKHDKHRTCAWLEESCQQLTKTSLKEHFSSTIMSLL